METQEQITAVRLKRNKRAAATRFLLSLKQEPVREPSWDALLALPYWCYWNEEHRQHLLMVCGALLVLPAVKLWIDGKKIKKARELLGEDVYRRVMDSKAIDTRSNLQVECDDVKEFLLSSGAAVLLSAVEVEMAEIVQSSLPAAAGRLPGNVAEMIQDEAGNILMAVREGVHPRPQVEDQPTSKSPD